MPRPEFFDLSHPVLVVDHDMSAVEIARLAAKMAPAPMPLTVYVAAPEPKWPDTIETLLLPIPGRKYSRGEITHKKFADMNRKERRAFLSGQKR